MVLGSNTNGHLFDTTFTTNGPLYSASSGVVTSGGAGSAGQIYQSAGAGTPPGYSTATYPSTAGSAGNILTSDGTNWGSTAPAIASPGSSTDRAIATWNGTGGAALFNNSTVTISSGGILTNTTQPCFAVYLSSIASNVTGNGTDYHIAWDTEDFDQGSNFTTGASAVFTAPVTGKYFFTATVLTQAQTIAAPTPQLSLVATSKTITFREDGIASVSGQNITYQVSGVIAMTATDTCFVNLQIGGGASDSTNVFGSAGGPYTFFSGYLVA